MVNVVEEFYDNINVCKYFFLLFFYLALCIEGRTFYGLINNPNNFLNLSSFEPSLYMEHLYL